MPSRKAERRVVSSENRTIVVQVAVASTPVGIPHEDSLSGASRHCCSGWLHLSDWALSAPCPTRGNQSANAQHAAFSVFPMQWTRSELSRSTQKWVDWIAKPDFKTPQNTIVTYFRGHSIILPPSFGAFGFLPSVSGMCHDARGSKRHERPEPSFVSERKSRTRGEPSQLDSTPLSS